MEDSEWENLGKIFSKVSEISEFFDLTTIYTATAKGFGLSAFRPVTIIPVFVEYNQHLKNRLGVQIHPSLHLLEENNCTIPVTVVNSRTIGKGREANYLVAQMHLLNIQ